MRPRSTRRPRAGFLCLKIDRYAGQRQLYALKPVIKVIPTLARPASMGSSILPDGSNVIASGTGRRRGNPFDCAGPVRLGEALSPSTSMRGKMQLTLVTTADGHVTAVISGVPVTNATGRRRDDHYTSASPISSTDLVRARHQRHHHAESGPARIP